MLAGPIADSLRLPMERATHSRLRLEERGILRPVSNDGSESGQCIHPSECALRRMRSICFMVSKPEYAIYLTRPGPAP